MANHAIVPISDINEDRAASNRMAFVAAMRCAPTAVSVVTTDGSAGRFGVTVSAIASVSADPPMLLACINRRSPVGAAVKQNQKFTVNLLSEQQTNIADCFAGRFSVDGGPAFDFGQAEWADDAADLPPRLEGACASFHCDVEQIHDAGTHVILIGRVVLAVSGSEPPLAYVRQNYARVMNFKPGLAA
ncbi:FMN reductase (NADH) RutF [Acidocella aquatica]|uniref:FMN reductase (NADH) RutF n=1 Tax=Acidocella aquatica TaxID=1922313 RepID=A0ABQ6A4G6_9PROT|nr:flavin reductase family protein [Acidocella aquatica]GLR67054.1 FMN reductase (NADH) RutF [Acidocella aquatica]